MGGAREKLGNVPKMWKGLSRQDGSFELAHLALECGKVRHGDGAFLRSPGEIPAIRAEGGLPEVLSEIPAYEVKPVRGFVPPTQNEPGNGCPRSNWSTHGK